MKISGRKVFALPRCVLSILSSFSSKRTKSTQTCARLVMSDEMELNNLNRQNDMEHSLPIILKRLTMYLPRKIVVEVQKRVRKRKKEPVTAIFEGASSPFDWGKVFLTGFCLFSAFCRVSAPITYSQNVHHLLHLVGCWLFGVEISPSHLYFPRERRKLKDPDVMVNV